MSTFSEHRRDYYGGGLMMLIGLGAALEAQRYGLGSLSHMGPGFFPVLLGVMMISVGALIAGTAYLSTEPDEESFLPRMSRERTAPSRFIRAKKLPNTLTRCRMVLRVSSPSIWKLSRLSRGRRVLTRSIRASTRLAASHGAATAKSQKSTSPARPEWFAWGCIIASPIAFIIFGEFAGLLPATFACVFVAAIGDRETTLPQAAGLGVFISILGLLIFSFLLKIPFPIIRGVW